MPARKKTRRPTRKRARTRERSRAPRRPEHPDALRLLAEDHARVKAMFARFERARGAARESLAERICQELTLHAELEEEIFYPRVREAIGDDDLMNEAEVEHASAKDLIGQIEAASPSDPRYVSLVTVLGEYVMHHVKEEEGQMFPRVRRSGLDRRALAEEMQRWKGDHRGGKSGLASLLGL